MKYLTSKLKLLRISVSFAGKAVAILFGLLKCQFVTLRSLLGLAKVRSLFPSPAVIILLMKTASLKTQSNAALMIIFSDVPSAELWATFSLT